MTLSPAAPASVDQVLDSLPLALSIEQFRPEPRCRVSETTSFGEKSMSCWQLGRATR
jgi:hypothetical protein